MDLQEQLEIGRQAEEFKRYTDENPYFLQLIERGKLTYAKQILGLNADQTDEFKRLKMAMDSLDTILNDISGEIYLGQQAYKKISGEPEDSMGLL